MTNIRDASRTTTSEDAVPMAPKPPKIIFLAAGATVLTNAPLDDGHVRVPGKGGAVRTVSN
ncbi:hypothetical protein [Plantactinospora sp. DSM 117369]